MNTYIFDLDETLYAPNEESTNQRIQYYTKAIQNKLNIESYDEARKIGHGFYLNYGTTFAGLAAESDITFEEFHSFSHHLDYTSFHNEDKELENLIKQLDGKKYIYSAGHYHHIQQVLKAIAIDINIFDGVFSNDCGDSLHPKPQKQTQQIFIEKYSIDKSTIIFLDDSASCIKSAIEDGWNKCVLVNNGVEKDLPYKQTTSVKDFLRNELNI